MSDDQDSKYPPISWLGEDADTDDPTIQLSLKDVFKISREDTIQLEDEGEDYTREIKFRPEDLLAYNIIQQNKSAQPTHTTLQEDTSQPAQTSVLSNFDKISTMDIMSEWPEHATSSSSTPTQASSPTNSPWASTQMPVSQATSVHSVPEALLAFSEEDEDTMNTSREEFIRQARPVEKQRTQEDPTIEISLTDFIAQHKPTQDNSAHAPADSAPATMKLSAVSSNAPAPTDSSTEQSDGSTVELEFVAAVDQNQRLFVPLHLFDEGTLKPGMRLLIKAVVLK